MSQLYKTDTRLSKEIAFAIVGGAIALWGAIQNRSHDPIHKTNTK